jgi:hypothetical protein
VAPGGEKRQNGQQDPPVAEDGERRRDGGERAGAGAVEPTKEVFVQAARSVAGRRRVGHSRVGP